MESSTKDTRPFCFVVIPEGAKGDRVRMIVEGDLGYRQTDLDQGETLGELEAKVLTFNMRLGLTDKQATAMVLRSMRDA